MSKGIDVSEHNGVIDWQKVKAGGIDFAIIRAGYGRITDKRFTANITGAHAAGIAVGVYWFVYALNESGAEAEADYCYNQIKGYKLDLPVYCDFEYDTERYAKEQGVTYTKASRTAIIRAFCERIKMRGCKTGVYLNPDYIKGKLNYNDLKCYPLWLALWVNNSVTSHASVADTKVSKAYGQPAMWQFGKGIISGINGYTDVNYGYENLPDITPAATPQAAPAGFSVGDKVKCNAGVKTFSNGVKMASWVSSALLYVRAVESSGKILLVSTEKTKAVYTGRVNASDVHKV